MLGADAAEVDEWRPKTKPEVRKGGIAQRYRPGVSFADVASEEGSEAGAAQYHRIQLRHRSRSAVCTDDIEKGGSRSTKWVLFSPAPTPAHPIEGNVAEIASGARQAREGKGSGACWPLSRRRAPTPYGAIL